MNVLVVMNSVNVTFGGGIVQVILNYCSHLCDEVNFDFAINEKSGCGLHKMFCEIGDNFYALPNKKENLAKYIKSLYKICKGKEYDAVHIHGNSANMLIELYIAKSAGIKKRVAHCHNSRCSHPRINKLLIPFFKKQYTNALACSETAGEWLFSKGKFEVLNNAIDLDRFAFNEKIRKQYRNLLNIDEDTIVLGHVGNINEQKNHEFLVDIFCKIVDAGIKAELVLIGNGPLKEQIEKKVSNLKLNNIVHFLGIREDVENWMQAMDIFVFPSKWEGLGMVAVEAQAAGLWVLASNEVPQAAKITDRFINIPLDSENVWVDTALECIRKDNNRIVNRNDFKLYDIKAQCEKLKEIYSRR